jgi:hypothetical protein
MEVSWNKNRWKSADRRSKMVYEYETCPKSNCTNFPMYDLRSTSVIYIGELVMTLAACSKLDRLSTSWAIVVCNVCYATVVPITKNFYLQDRQLIISSIKCFEATLKTGPASQKDIAGDWGLHHDIAPAHRAFPPFPILPTAQI